MQEGEYLLRRFIPASAGNTGVGQIPNLNNPVYPRWRGEHNKLERNFAHAPGLSPLARGTRAVSCRIVPRTRFIPAGAGNTSENCRQ